MRIRKKGTIVDNEMCSIEWNQDWRLFIQVLKSIETEVFLFSPISIQLEIMVSFHSVLRVRRMNDELDLNQLQSIAYGLFAFDNYGTIDSNEEYLAIKKWKYRFSCFDCFSYR